MAEMVTIDGQQYMKRNPLGVLGLSVITLGIYFFVWYYKINDEVRRFENDQTISPTRSLMAMIFGWLIIVPPFIAMYNTAKHVQTMETRMGVRQTVEPALTIVLMFVFSIGNTIYIQEHMNRAWDQAVGTGQATPPPSFPPPPPPS
jgi:mannose/fructose/N-acetylgalactosamine-specific phosphotransferase system component IIC